jgi:sulfur carrier protein ThiS adenylyltransferase
LIKIFLNEIPLAVTAGMRLTQLKADHAPQADLLIINGFPISEDAVLQDQDRIVMIQRGVMPDRDQLEALMMARHTPGVHEKVSQSCVGIAGVGGLGSNVAIALTRLGIGQLILADFDLVEPSNLNRQQYFIDQIGMPKVEALKANLKRINPWVKIDVFAGRIDATNLRKIFGRVDVMVEAFDAPDQKALLTATHLRQAPDCPLVAASGMAGYAASNQIRTRKIRDNFYLIGDQQTSARPGCGLMAPRVGIAAHHQANAVLRLLMGKEPE